jgi:hypothetical protein
MQRPGGDDPTGAKEATITDSNISTRINIIGSVGEHFFFTGFGRDLNVTGHSVASVSALPSMSAAI